MAGRSVIWVRRLALAATLAVAAVAPGPSAGPIAAACAHPGCEAGGRVLWARLLPGRWVADNGLTGAVPAHGQAYAALGAGVAAVGAGLSLEAFGAASGKPLWSTRLADFPAGSAIVSVRAWAGVVTAGVSIPPLAGAASAVPRREEVVLDAGDGRLTRRFPAAPYGGAVAASRDGTVVVGVSAVTSYADRSGRVLWSRPTGPGPQAWQKDGRYLYVAAAAGGYLGGAPVTALRRIDLTTGRERLVRPRRRAYAGTLSLAFDGVVLFSGAEGVTAYSGATGARLWRRGRTLPESVDALTRRLYLLSGSALVGVDPWTGATLSRVSGAGAVGSSGLFGVRGGTVFGLDHGALGKAWGYDAAVGRVIWTSAPLPWPHYFVDLSGIGGSASPSQDVVLLAICAELGQESPSGVQACARPELVALSR